MQCPQHYGCQIAAFMNFHFYGQQISHSFGAANDCLLNVCAMVKTWYMVDMVIHQSF